jgi:hypothetical protein
MPFLIFLFFLTVALPYVAVLLGSGIDTILDERHVQARVRQQTARFQRDELEALRQFYRIPFTCAQREAFFVMRENYPDDRVMLEEEKSP